MGAQVMRIAHHAALAAAERNVDNGTLPGHPHGQGAYGVDGLLRVEAHAALAGAAGVVVLDAEAAEHVHVAVVHADRDGERILPHGNTQEFPRGGVETDGLRHLVELRLGNLE